MSSPLSVLVTGASGYIGSCLLDILLDSSHTVYSMLRRPKQFKKSYTRKHSIRYGDTNNYESLLSALKGIDVAFYFIHSLAEGDDFIESEKLSAINFVKAAEANNVKRIIYLGGLFDDSQKLSFHLQYKDLWHGKQQMMVAFEQCIDPLCL